MADNRKKTRGRSSKNVLPLDDSDHETKAMWLRTPRKASTKTSGDKLDAPCSNDSGSDMDSSPPPRSAASGMKSLHSFWQSKKKEPSVSESLPRLPVEDRTSRSSVPRHAPLPVVSCYRDEDMLVVVHGSSQSGCSSGSEDEDEMYVEVVKGNTSGGESCRRKSGRRGGGGQGGDVCAGG